MKGDRNTDKNVRKFITIRDMGKWEQIEKLLTISRYKKSFNAIINDALDYGLPLLIKAEFGEIELQNKTISGEAFASGCFQETPQYIENYELQALKALRV